MNTKGSLTIAIDAMGGDFAPYSVLAGAEKIALKSERVKFLLFGDAAILNTEIVKYPALLLKSEIIHSDDKVAPDEKPSIALRHSKKTSMGMAIEAVKDGRADAIVSSGNTGALMAIAKLALRALPGIHRPAIVGMFPSKGGKIVMLDLGANAECDADNLFQFAIMGDAFAKLVLDLREPKVALLNIGSEDVKGNEAVRSAAAALRITQNPINFCGFIEGNDIINGVADVVVTDGFSGNIAIKTAEGTAILCKDFLREAFAMNIFTKIGYLLARSSIKKAFTKFDHRLYNGAMFVGLNGIVIKSHGSADEVAYANAISVAIELASKDINKKIIKELEFSKSDIDISRNRTKV